MMYSRKGYLFLLKRCQLLIVVFGFVVIFTVFCLILWVAPASRPYKPRAFVKPRKSHRTVLMNLEGNKVPLYAAGASLAASDNNEEVPIGIFHVPWLLTLITTNPSN
ncbi:hypothetical protein CFP56_008358 [Quercus suber]|uniref:Uncharacterized protein n=1 Tax=Quercus suber TaxID=58331 RepID=A0AAW0L4U1_QUESU